MQYTAIVKDGGLFIPDILADLEENHTVEITLDVVALRKLISVKTKDLDKAPKKVSLSDFHISAFDNIKDPVEWQNSQRHSKGTDNQVESAALNAETSKQAKILSFAGSWQELDKNILSADSIEKRRLESLKERNT